MPELVNSSVLSPPGTNGMEGTSVCPRSAKKSRKPWRMSRLESSGRGKREGIVVSTIDAGLYVRKEPPSNCRSGAGEGSEIRLSGCLDDPANEPPRARRAAAKGPDWA